VLVVDASAVVDLCLSETGFDVLAGQELIAPPLVRPESLSVLHAMHWRGAISATVANAALKRLASAPVTIREPSGLALSAWQIAEDFGWKKTYDAEYVALAGLLGCRLLTLDGRLRQGTRRLGFVVSPNEI
jgi:predicted nucleic acid-binding protein